MATITTSNRMLELLEPGIRKIASEYDCKLVEMREIDNSLTAGEAEGVKK